MLDEATFDRTKAKYGHWASWAIWTEAGTTPKSNAGDLSIFTGTTFLQYLNIEIVLVGLNISRGAIKEPLANFHDSRTEATDYKIRYALKDTPFWGGYMTDIIKDYDEKESGKVAAYLRANRHFEQSNVALFREEILALGSTHPTIVAFGNDAYSILLRNLKDDFRVVSIPHYANYSSKEKYREQVMAVALTL